MGEGRERKALRGEGQASPAPARLLITLLLVCACTRGETAALPQLKSALAERDHKLTTYRFTGEAHQGDAIARHAFAFRSPNKMRGTVLEPVHVEWAFDGTTLAQSKPAEKRLLVYPLKLSAAKASVFLHDTFSPFVFEGFRAPLLPANATAKQLDGKVEVSATLTDASGPVQVRYLFKWPSADFLSKTSVVNGVESVLQVDEEQCDAKLGLCVPKAVSQRSGGQLIGTTKLTNIELNPELSQSEFTLEAADGWTTETHDVVDAP